MVDSLLSLHGNGRGCRYSMRNVLLLWCVGGVDRGVASWKPSREVIGIAVIITENPYRLMCVDL